MGIFQDTLKAQQQPATQAGGGLFTPPAPEAPPTPSLGELDAQQLGGGVNKIISSVKTAGQKLATNANDSSFMGGINSAGDVLEGVLGAGAGAVQAGFAPLTATLQKVFNNNGAPEMPGANPLAGDKSSPLVAPIAYVNTAIKTWAQQHPEASQNLMDALTVGGVALGGSEGILGKTASEMTVGDAANTLKNATTEAASTATGLVKGTGGKMLQFATSPIATTKEAVTNLAQGSVPAAVEGLAAKYQELADTTTKTSKILDKGQAATVAKDAAGTTGRPPERVLAEAGIIPKQNGTKLDTLGQAADFRKTVTPLREALGTAIKDIKYAVTPTPIDALESGAVSRVVNQAGTEGDKLSLVKDIKDEFNLLRQKYGDSMTLQEMYDRNPDYWKGTKFDSTKPFRSDSFYQVGKSLQEGIQTSAKQAGFDAVAQLNREVGDRLEGAKFLESLNNKTVKGGRLSKYLYQVIGASLGHSIPGKIAGALGGDAVANMLISTTVAGPVKRLILQHLEQTNPAAYTQTLKWLEDNKILQEARPQLPPGPELGTARNPIITPPPADKSSVTSVPAKKTFPTQDPKTGRMQKTYTSEPAPPPAPPKGNGAASPNKTALTSKIVPETLGGRVKQALQNYLDNTQAGLSTKDVTEGGQKFNVGLTAVRGALESASDHLVTEAETLYKAGDFAGAQAKYNEALKAGAQTLNDAFNNTGIKVKVKGVGLGIYDGGIEPNYDMTATVPNGKADLFHYILYDIAEKNFHQYSALTYRQVAHDAPLGISDAAKGMSNEPAFRFTVEKPLTAEDISKITTAAKEAGVQALSVREGGTAIDVVNITSYNKDYGQFAKQATDFQQALDKQGIVGNGEHTTQEVRFAGSDPSQGHGAVSYDDLRSNFRTQNPGYFNTDSNFTSKIIERLKNKQSVSAQEVEQLTKSQDITPTERGVVLDSLADLKATGATRVPTDKFVATVEGKALPISMKTTDQYATYGLREVGLSDYHEPGTPMKAQTLVFESPVEHGVQGHFDSPNHIGHVRTYIEEDSGKKVGYITELQSDVFQKNSPEDLASRFAGKDAGSGKEPPLTPQQQQFLHQAKNARYQDTLLRGTLQHFQEQGVDTVRFVTPSSAAKIEGYINDEDTAPYQQANGDPIGRDTENLTHGDTITYLDEDHTVVDTNGDSITVAPSDKVHSFSFNDYVQQEIEQGWEDRVMYDLKDRTVGRTKITDEASLEKLTSAQAQKLLDTEKDFNMGDKYLEYRADGLDHEEAKQKMEEKFSEGADFSNLEDIYGRGNVFSHEIGKGYDSTIYTVDGDTETLGQPDTYSNSMSSDNADAIDPTPGGSLNDAKKEINNNFDSTQATVLRGYVDLFGTLQKLAKEQNVSLKYETGNHDSTWYEFPLTKIKRNLFGS